MSKSVSNMIDQRLGRLRDEGGHGLMAHIVVGYPDLAASERILLTLRDSGADLIELQIPFTDPLADGPTILKANLAALEGGVKVADCLKFAERMARRMGGVPLLFMTYINIPFTYGLERFCTDSANAGVSGLIVPDIPPDEPMEHYHELATGAGLHPIYILSPSSTDERIGVIGSYAGGFVYCTARVGITGAREQQIDGLKDFIGHVRARVDTPLALGFGISRAEHVAQVRDLVDVSVVGSKVIDTFNNAEDTDAGLAAIKSFIEGLRG
ncbi:MAG: tryptophan synthase subunit alpha [Candidatus Glassbacteria bacterium]|nr:tryptophan synthase subunit alpha [Candidatus Glassbacteria bacterium]